MAKDAERLAEQAQRLRDLKRFARVTNRDIADATGVTERQVQRWTSESQPSDIESQNLKKLAAYLGTSPDYIEYGTDRKRAGIPKLLESLDLEAKIDLLVGLPDQISQLEEQVRLLRAELAAHDAEVLQRVEAARSPTRATRRQQQ